MTDLIYIAVTLAFFVARRALRPLLRNPLNLHTMETIIVGLIALLLIGYLFVAMLHPEKF